MRFPELLPQSDLPQRTRRHGCSVSLPALPVVEFGVLVLLMVAGLR